MTLNINSLDFFHKIVKTWIYGLCLHMLVSTTLFAKIGGIKMAEQSKYIFAKSNITEKPIIIYNEKLLQSINITGQVTSSDFPGGLSGVNVLIKGTNIGTVTDVNGNYNLEVQSNETILVYSSYGYLSKEEILDSRSVINVSLKIDETALNETVATAFGIEKEKKTLVYSTQAVNGKDLVAVGNSNLLNGLQGKAAGVAVNLNSGMPGNSPEIIIRGHRSFRRSNAPLYVIDGMPVAGGRRQMDFNPNDIDNINILKGQAASALYGLRAANGVVIITTKSGKGASGKPTVTFNSHFNIDEAAFLPNTQKVFSQGINGVFNPNSFSSWGPRISELGTYTNQRGEQEQAAAYDNQRDFYQRGRTINNNLTFANGSDVGNFSIGIGHTKQLGIIQNTDMTRANMKINGQLNVSKRFTVSASINYSDLSVNDFPDADRFGSLLKGVIDAPASYNLKGNPFAETDDPFSQINFNPSENNPYWVINNNFRTEDVKRTFGNIFLKYDFSESFSLNYRVGADHFSKIRREHREMGDGIGGRATPPSGGSLSITNILSTQANSNLFLSYNKELLRNLRINAIVGNEIFKYHIDRTHIIGRNYIMGGFPFLSNTLEIGANSSQSTQRLVGYYANTNISWKEVLFLNASVRYDNISEAVSTHTYFYPSIGMGLLLTEAIPSLGNVFSFAKLRASYAEVGQIGSFFINDLDFPSIDPFPIIQEYSPENTRSYEMGFDFRFLDNRVELDYTFYRNVTDWHLLSTPFSGVGSLDKRFATEVLSKGHEIMLSLSIIRSAKMNWRLNTNFSTYTNNVEYLPGDIQNYRIASGGGISMVAHPGESFPGFFGTSFLRDPATNQKVIQSDPALTSSYGLPIPQSNYSYLGTSIPDFEFNFINNSTLLN
ncbi:MAG: SusC/RagA family TonB-linked outer membrane protein, partial [Cyclobacteriaceae bacterium]